ncbi:MAG: hypothetical protein LW606_01980 [Ilumatobacteraceae bacterium]|jgi:hypothetical protein|nr:hypothetical protein [Ilumatobacteraceae bacterium]
MDAQLDGTQTRGLKGQPYDWQDLLVPDEPTFTRELSELIDGEFVGELK